MLSGASLSLSEKKRVRSFARRGGLRMTASATFFSTPLGFLS
jgi:hypothetical protein